MNSEMVGAFVFAIISFVLGFSAGSSYESNIHNDQLVRDGYAEYYLDENNEKQFRMLEQRKVK